MFYANKAGGEYADMDHGTLYVQMLGECSLSLGSVKIRETGNRSSKVWLLLAYLICNRSRSVSQDTLIEALWGSDVDEHRGALKTTVWRARQMLQPLSPENELIICKSGSYRWNPDVPTEVDAEQFEALCRTAAASDEESVKRDAFLEGLSLYQGDFLEKFSSENWVEPLFAYYCNLYIHSAQELLNLLPREIYTQQIMDLCRTALRFAPYHEVFYQHLMLCLLYLQDAGKAADVYEEMRQKLLSLGVTPSEESQAILAEIHGQNNIPFLTPDLIRENLCEKDPPPGAFFCDYSAFKLFYRSEARSAARRGDAIHVGIFSVTGAEGKNLSQASLDRAMEQLRAKIQTGLRRGDVVSRCSASQFVVLLLQANYENSNMVCQRLVSSFTQAHPRSPVQIQFTVLPLEPLDSFLSSSSSLSGGMHGWGI